MSWRTVVISNRCKLDLKLGYMVVRGEETRRIFLDEVALVLIENPAVQGFQRPPDKRDQLVFNRDG